MIFAKASEPKKAMIPPALSPVIKIKDISQKTAGKDKFPCIRVEIPAGEIHTSPLLIEEGSEGSSNGPYGV